jgi:hypothetical protein
MEYKDIKGTLALDEMKWDAVADATFKDNGEVVLKTRIDSPDFDNHMQNLLKSFYDENGDIKPGSSYGIAEFEGKSQGMSFIFKRLFFTYNQFNEFQVFNCNKGRVINRDKEPNRVVFGIMNFIAFLPIDYFLEFNGIKIRIRPNEHFHQNQEDTIRRIKEDKEILLTSEIEITGEEFFKLSFEEQNRFVDYLMFILSFVCRLYSVWSFRKDYLESQEISSYQRDVGCLPYFSTYKGLVDYHRRCEWQTKKSWLENLLAKFIRRSKDEKEQLTTAIDFYLHSFSISKYEVSLLVLCTSLECIEDFYYKSNIDTRFTVVGTKVMQGRSKLTHKEKLIFMRDYLNVPDKSRYPDLELEEFLQIRHDLVHKGEMDVNLIDKIWIRSTLIINLIQEILIKILLNS